MPFWPTSDLSHIHSYTILEFSVSVSSDNSAFYLMWYQHRPEGDAVNALGAIDNQGERSVDKLAAHPLGRSSATSVSMI